MVFGLCHTERMLIALLVLALIPGVAQDQEKKPAGPPKKGDTVVVKGCFQGSALESSGIARKGGDEHFTEPLRYRLTGDKNVLKTMKAGHDGKVLIVTAELRTDLPKAGYGTKIGNSRIAVGVGGSRGMMPEPPPPVPVLKVSAFEDTGISCK
jgi:hypothetical protein